MRADEAFGPHARTGAIKHLLSTLPEPLLKPDVFHGASSLQSTSTTNSASLLVAIREAVTRGCTEGFSVAEAHARWATLNFVVRHLRQVESHRETNRMTFGAISICLAPVLFGAVKPTEATSFAKVSNRPQTFQIGTISITF